MGSWIWGISGRLEGGGRAVDVDADWTDAFEVLDLIEFSVNAGMRVQRGRWSFSARVNGVELRDSTELVEVNAGPTGGSASAWFVQAQVGYGFAGGSLGCGPCSFWCAEAVVGARACWTSLELDAGTGANPAPAVDTDLNWIDPLVGARLDVQLDRKWFLVFDGDVGGFGIGSDLAWYVSGTLGYRFSRHVFLELGWRVLDVDYHDGADAFDAQLSGPLLRLGFTW